MSAATTKAHGVPSKAPVEKKDAAEQKAPARKVVAEKLATGEAGAKGPSKEAPNPAVTKRKAEESKEERPKKKVKLPSTCLWLKGEVEELMLSILQTKISGLKKALVHDNDVWGCCVSEKKAEKAVGRWVMFNREVKVVKAPEGSPGDVLFCGGHTVLSDYVQRDLAAYGAVGLITRDGRIYVDVASEEFARRLLAKGIVEIRKLKFEVLPPSK